MFGKIKEEYLTLSYDGGKEKGGRRENKCLEFGVAGEEQI